MAESGQYLCFILNVALGSSSLGPCSHFSCLRLCLCSGCTILGGLESCTLSFPGVHVVCLRHAVQSLHSWKVGFSFGLAQRLEKPCHIFECMICVLALIVRSCLVFSLLSCVGVVCIMWLMFTLLMSSLISCVFLSCLI